MRREVRELKGDKGALELYLTGIANLRSSGVLNALRALGRPTRYNNGKDPNEMVSEASWSAGFNDCLDALQHFQELYLEDAPPPVTQVADFGAIDVAVARGDLTAEEANARKQSGKYTPPDIQSVTRNLKPPTRT